MPEVTVVVPSYNHAPFIERSLRSIFAQTLTPKKLIVIDDGSKDESADVIERWREDHDPPFDWEMIFRENRGLCATLNDGLARTDTEYFAYLGSDDIWLPSFLEEQAELLESRRKAVLAFSHAYVIDDADNIIDRTDNWTPFADGDMLPLLLRGVIFSSPTVLYRTAPLRKYGWNEDARLEDYELYLRLCANGEFARNEKVLAAWRQHETNTSDDFSLMLKEHIAAQDRLAEHLGLDRAELDKVQRELKFHAVADLIRSGSKSEAFTLFRENIGGAGSFADMVKTATRLAVPQALFQWNRGRKRKQAGIKYGKLEL
jgi:alpha-1,3-rhamnosyltransferase